MFELWQRRVRISISTVSFDSPTEETRSQIGHVEKVLELSYPMH